MATTVALFEQSGCPTAGAEEFLRRNRTEFADYDISKDEVTRRRLVEELNSGATATLVIDGEIIMGSGQTAQAWRNCCGIGRGNARGESRRRGI